ncbi:hypothetical protein BBJ28_00026479 [Nothophytophthora sp. Chile5]|nr:hypothetical protein BBJ28_00026479 [Nothophytophthora sp. Chile5]
MAAYKDTHRAMTLGEASEDEKVVLNNMWLARRVHELPNFLQLTAQYLATGATIHLVGFGNSDNVATWYAEQLADAAIILRELPPWGDSFSFP